MVCFLCSADIQLKNLMSSARCFKSFNGYYVVNLLRNNKSLEVNKFCKSNEYVDLKNNCMAAIETKNKKIINITIMVVEIIYIK